MITKGDYGTVLILKGEYEGVVGYYDDDINHRTALVYVGVNLFEKGVEIPRKDIEPTPPNVISIVLKRLLTKHPEVRDYFGIREREVHNERSHF